MKNNNSAFKISAEDRQSWQSIALVWIGAMVCVPCLMVGGMLGAGLTIGKTVIVSFLGYGIVCLYMSFMGIQGCDTGLPTAIIAGGSLGEKGGQYIVSFILTVACIGWFGIQASVCGQSFSAMIGEMTGFVIPVWASSTAWGVIMVSTACFGFKGLKWLNYIAVPLLIIVLAYGVLVAVVRNDGVKVLINYAPEEEQSLITYISMTVGTFAVGGSLAADYCRFAKNRKDVIKSSVLGVLPAGMFILIIGAILAIVTGEYDISIVLTAVGVPAIGLLALIAATWTTNVTNAYSGGLSLSILLGLDEKRSRICTGAAGLVGTVLAVLGIMTKFVAFLTLLCALVPPFVGVVIADYWLLRGGKKENFTIRPGIFVPGIIAFICGAFVACLTGGTFTYFEATALFSFPFFIGPLNGMIVSIAVYYALMKIFKIET